MVKWIGVQPKGIKAYPLKKLIPVEVSQFHTVRRVNFGLYGQAYVIFNLQGTAVLCDAGECPIWHFYLRTPGEVVGMRNLIAAQHKPWAEEWREAGNVRIMEALNEKAAL